MTLRQPHSRHGITLMEVLISMFVAAVGLMGLAALIPVGRHNIQEAGKSDRANAVARAAYREIKTRGWLNANNLFGSAGGGASPVMSAPFCIDPMFMHFPANSSAMTTGGTPGYGWYAPVQLDNDPQFCDGSLFPPRMFRATIRPFSGATTSINFATADRLFRCEDDKVFERPTDDTKRARAVLGDDNRMQSNGDYSWMATVVPVYQTTGTATPSTYKVSVVVFQKRSLLIPDQNKPNRAGAPPSERYVHADFISGGVGVGGGDVRLRLPDSSATTSTSPEESDFPRVRPGQWIMLVALKTDPSAIPVVEWYRVVSASKRADGQDGPELMTTGTPSTQPEWFIDVTLDGQTWDPIAKDTTTGLFATPDMDRGDPADYTATNGPYMTVYAGVFENVVGVYTKTIEVDSWATP